MSNRVTLIRNAVHVAEKDPYEGIGETEQKRLAKYLSIRKVEDTWAISPKPRYAGLLNVGGTTYWLEPPFSPASFVYLLLRYKGLTGLADQAYLLASSRENRSIEDLMQVLSVLMVDTARVLASGHIAQSYLRKVDRLSLIRGRPLWHRQGRRPADGTVICQFDEKSTDTLENRLVRAGLDAAARWLPTGSDNTGLRTQQFVWHALAEPYYPSPHDFDIADIRLNRLTFGYKSALSIARALLFGFDLNAPKPDTHIVAPVFDLSILFEQLVGLVAAAAVSGTDLTVTSQSSERRAIVTRVNETYRAIRPDLIIKRLEQPVLIIDSKFKPKYAEGGPRPGGYNKMSREDIFQTFFYAHRIAQRSGLTLPIPAAIAAPKLTDLPEPLEDYRHVHWGEDVETSGTRLSLVLVPVDQAVQAVIRRDVGYCREILESTGVLST